MSGRSMFYGGLVAGLFAGVAAALLRPAPLRAARLTATVEGTYPFAIVSLERGVGRSPASVIVDVSSATGGGSATVMGDQRSTEVRLTGPLAEPYRIATTATYQIFGRLRTIRQQF